MLRSEGYPLEWLQELKDKNNLIEIVSRYVPLTQKGNRFWGCCPFHHEKTPSFSVNEEGFYYCFGCRESGDVITFVQKIEGLTFPEAVQMLAERAGMQVPNTVNIQRSADNKKKRDKLYEILAVTAKFYHECLMSDKGEAARAYLEKRGIGKNLMIRFGLGYSPDFNAVIDFLKQKGYSEADIIESGAGWTSEKARRPFDALQKRMIVPIIDGRGRVIAFSGRVITKEYTGGKYVHFHNTAVFEKNKTLYGVNFVKKEKIKNPIDKVIIVEGYMDVISLAKYGFNNAVAGMGTALCVGQIRELKALSENIYVCYDGDAAGEAAALKNLALINAEGGELHVISVPDKLDPDDYLRKYGRDGFEKLIAKALPYVEYMLEVFAKRYDLKTNTGRAKYVKDALDFIKQIPNEAQREVYLEIIHDKSRVATNILREGFNNEFAPAALENRSYAVKPEDTNAEIAAARFVLNALVSGYAFADADDLISEEVFGGSDVHKAVYNYVKNEKAQGRRPSAHMLYSVSQDEEAANILNAVKEFSDENKQVRFYRDSVRLLNGNYLNYKIKSLSQQFDNAAGDDKKKLFEELIRCQQRLKENK